MATRLVKVEYESKEAYDRNGKKVEEIIVEDTGHPPVQTKTKPPIISPLQLTPGAIDQLRALYGVRVVERNGDDH